MTVFQGSEAIKEILEQFDSWLSESVTVYLLGGTAMTVRDLKDQTKDIDMALGIVPEFEHVFQTLQSVAGDDLGEVQVWSTPDPDESASVAELLDDAEDAAEDVVTGDEDTAAETQLERAISALQAAKSAL